MHGSYLLCLYSSFNILNQQGWYLKYYSINRYGFSNKNFPHINQILFLNIKM